MPPPSAIGDAFAQRLAFVDALDPDEALSLAFEERERLRLGAEELAESLRKLTRGVEPFPDALDDVTFGHYVSIKVALGVLRARAAASGEAVRLLQARRDPDA